MTMDCSEELNRRVQGVFVMPDFVSDDIENDGFYKAVCRLLDRREKV